MTTFRKALFAAALALGLPGTAVLADGATPPAASVYRDGAQDFAGALSRSIDSRTHDMDIQPNSHRFEQSFSDDNGKTWEPNFVAWLTRISP
jgi:hypothetical protein